MSWFLWPPWLHGLGRPLLCSAAPLLEITPLNPAIQTSAALLQSLQNSEIIGITPLNFEKQEEI